MLTFSSIDFAFCNFTGSVDSELLVRSIGSVKQNCLVYKQSLILSVISLLYLLCAVIVKILDTLLGKGAGTSLFLILEEMLYSAFNVVWVTGLFYRPFIIEICSSTSDVSRVC